MRQLSAATNLILTALGAIVVAFALHRPWYAAAPADTDVDAAGHFRGPVEQFGDGVGRWFSEEGATATDVLGPGAGWMIHLVVATLVLCALCSWPAALVQLRMAMRVVPVGLFVLVGLHVVDQPGTNSLVELRWGGFIALAGAALAASAASHVADARVRVPARPSAVPTVRFSS